MSQSSFKIYKFDPSWRSYVDLDGSYENQDINCIFCKISNGDSPADYVTYMPSSFAVVPINPVTPGHLIFMPHRHVTDFADQPEISGYVMEDVASFVADYPHFGSANIITSKGAAATQSVFHLHIHLVPRFPDDGLMLPWSNQ